MKTPTPPSDTVPNFTRTGTSLHRQVYLVLRDRLYSGVFRTGDQLPPEPALCEQFGVSRITLRRAVSDLERDGLLERAQGRGTFVKSVPRAELAHGAGYVEDICRMSADTVVKVMEFGQVPAHEDAASRLQVPPGALALRSVRVRLHEKLPIALLTAWVPLALARDIRRADLTHHSLNELLAQQGVRFGRVLQHVSASLADPLQARWLQVELGSALLIVDRLVYDHDGKPVEYVHIALSPDRSRMVFDTPAELAEHVSSGRIVHIGKLGAAKADEPMRKAPRKRKA